MVYQCHISSEINIFIDFVNFLKWAFLANDGLKIIFFIDQFNLPAPPNPIFFAQVISMTLQNYNGYTVRFYCRERMSVAGLEEAGRFLVGDTSIQPGWLQNSHSSLSSQAHGAVAVSKL